MEQRIAGIADNYGGMSEPVMKQTEKSVEKNNRSNLKLAFFIKRIQDFIRR